MRFALYHYLEGFHKGFHRGTENRRHSDFERRNSLSVYLSGFDRRERPFAREHWQLGFDDGRAARMRASASYRNKILRALCSVDDTRPHLMAPFSVTLPDGRSYDCATDGHHLVAVEGASAPPASTDLYRKVAPVLSASAGQIKLNLADILAWAGPPETPGFVPCAECKGKGCDSCADDDDTEATKGKVWRDCARPGIFGGIRVDRNILARTLTLFAPGNVRVTIRKDDQPIDFDGDGFRVVVMPMRWPEQSDPVFEPLRARK